MGKPCPAMTSNQNVYRNANCKHITPRQRTFSWTLKTTLFPNARKVENTALSNAILLLALASVSTVMGKKKTEPEGRRTIQMISTACAPPDQLTARMHHPAHRPTAWCLLKVLECIKSIYLWLLMKAKLLDCGTDKDMLLLVWLSIAAVKIFTGPMSLVAQFTNLPSIIWTKSTMLFELDYAVRKVL